MTPIYKSAYLALRAGETGSFAKQASEQLGEFLSELSSRIETLPVTIQISLKVQNGKSWYVANVLAGIPLSEEEPLPKIEDLPPCKYHIFCDDHADLICPNCGLRMRGEPYP